VEGGENSANICTAEAEAEAVLKQPVLRETLSFQNPKQNKTKQKETNYIHVYFFENSLAVTLWGRA